MLTAREEKAIKVILNGHEAKAIELANGLAMVTEILIGGDLIFNDIVRVDADGATVVE